MTGAPPWPRPYLVAGTAGLVLGLLTALLRGRPSPLDPEQASEPSTPGGRETEEQPRGSDS